MTTPSVEEGLSILACLIQGREACCPQVVVIRNGTAERAHPMMRRANPTMKRISAR